MQRKFKWTSPAARALLMVGAGALLCVATPAVHAEESDSAAQKPFIMLLVDTSGSMEWTDEGDEYYPRGASETDRWALEKPLTTLDPTQAHYYGPCRVWLPSCSDYSRPTWNWSSEFASNRNATELAAESDMRDTAHRLSSNSQPRHVTLKEILTGDMVLAEPGFTGNLKGLSRLTHGPGCWLVPRQRGAANNGDMCSGVSGSKFDKYPDATDPLPHFQEVFDTQLPNGLMDTMGNSAIFGLAMLDSYQHSKKLPNGTDAPAKDWDGDDKNYAGKHIDDVMDKAFAGIEEGKGGQSEMYNLGVFQMIVPKSFEMSSSVAGHVSSFVQYALIDAGYLNTSDDYELKIGKDKSDAGPVYDGKKIEFSKKLDGYLKDYPLGKQPVARATPLAAAIYDIHQFFAHGEKGEGNNKGPVMEDNYRECRPKQVVVITDGKPEPELAGGKIQLDDTLNPTFGYNKAQYPYTYTEEAINFFVNDYNYGRTFDSTTQEASFTPTPRSNSYLAGSWAAGESTDAYLKALNYDPRVHIVGINAQADPSGQALNTSVIGKMAEMAISGRTCAEYYLNEDWIPTTDPSGKGKCDPDKKFCLDIRQAEYMQAYHSDYKYLARNKDRVDCKYPALVLSVPANPDDPSVTLAKRTTEGLQLLFNHIISSGLSSRTRPTYVNRLDDPSPTQVQGGQYRYFSGVNTEPGSVFWKGQLYRQAQLCSNPNDPTPPVLDIGEQINALAGKVEILANGNRHQSRPDYRRIFTSFTAWHPAYFEDPSLNSGVNGFPGTLGNRFALRADLASKDASADQFDGTYLPHKPTNLTGTRVPFEYTQMQNVHSKLAQDPHITQDLTAYFQTRDTAGLLELIDEVRGRSEAKQGRALGAILNASPVAVEPPDQALPIDSYRAFQVQNANRPSMIYSATADGLLHAIYAGELAATDSDQVVLEETGAAGSMNAQREAWAYLPQMLHTRLASYQGKQPVLLDGTPTVKDVRLCHQGDKADDYNLNKEACAYTAESTTEPDPAFQWRTVLVAGLGEAGSGYYALDVTRPGGVLFGDPNAVPKDPDPIPLWEFDPQWERFQVERMAEKGHAELAHPSVVGGDLSQLIPSACRSGWILGGNDFWNQSFMGISVGEPAIGTVVVDGNFKTVGSSNTERLRRPIAVFSGGVAEEGLSTCEKARRGRAVYVVDLQTGSLLRRFVSYKDELGVDTPFEQPVSGSPALYDSRPGSLVTRGFVGDSAGRLFRMDLSDPDPAQWKMELFFDPATISGYGTATPFGPAAFKPALVKSSSELNNDLLVFYGLGERGDLSVGGTKQLMIAVREKTEVTISGSTATLEVTGEELWHHEFENTLDDTNSEKLTSAPVVFNGGVYFTTFVEPGADLCDPGWSRIYGMTFQGDLEPGETNFPVNPKGLFRTSGASDMELIDVEIPTGTTCVPQGGTRCLAYEPNGAGNLAEPVVVRGLTVTLGQTCLAAGGNASDGTTPVQQSGSSQTPTLMAQSTSKSLSGSGATSVGGSSSGSSNNDNGIFSIEQNLADPRTQYIPLSWAVIDN